MLEAMTRLRAASMPLTYLIAATGRIGRASNGSPATTGSRTRSCSSATCRTRPCRPSIVSATSSCWPAASASKERLKARVSRWSCSKPRHPAGRPVTGKYDGSANWLVDGQTGLLVDSADPDAIATALQRLVHPDLRARMGRAARVHAEALFSVPAYTAARSPAARRRARADGQSRRERRSTGGEMLRDRESRTSIGWHVQLLSLQR